MYAILATITPKAGSLQKVSIQLLTHKVNSQLCSNAKSLQVTDLVKAIGKYAEEHEPECVEFRLCTEVDPEGVEAIYTIEK